MSYTMQQIVDIARKPLEDDDKDRYSDADLLGYVVSALLLLRTKRPDFFFGTFSSLTDLSALTLVSTFPLDDQYAQGVADYATARASTHDSDHVTSGRVQQFFDLFGMGAL